MKQTRTPVIAIMGHIDHGKSTLLAYIRKSKKPLNEAGGITQHISAYEIVHKTKDGVSIPLTFLDTPGHEAFSGIRTRGASIADIAVLVVSAEDGVKPQTLEALKMIKQASTPFIIAMTKIDKPEAQIDRTKLSLAENEIYVEGYGGTISAIGVSAKTGEGVDDLLDMICLTAELENLSYDTDAPASGYILESSLDVKKGIGATCIIKDGTMAKGMYIASGTSISPIRSIENFEGAQIDQAHAGQPVRIVGWDTLPRVGDTFTVWGDKKEALAHISETEQTERTQDDTSFSGRLIPVVVKADAGGTLEAVIKEVKKLDGERIKTKIIHSGIGTITEGDIKNALGTEKALIIGFNTKADSLARTSAERNGVEIYTFDIIYKLSEWLQERLTQETPKVEVEEVTGVLKVLKTFSKSKDKQILGGLVETGTITLGAQVKIMRRESEIGQGKIRELQSQKVKTDEVGAGKECGMLVEAKIEIVSGDRLHAFITKTQ